MHIIPAVNIRNMTFVSSPIVVTFPYLVLDLISVVAARDGTWRLYHPDSLKLHMWGFPVH